MANGLAAEVRPLSWTVRRLDWDTSFFGASMGELLLDGDAYDDETLWQKLRDAIELATAGGFHHLILRCGSDDWAVTWAAERAGLRLVDLGVDLECRDLPAGVTAPGIRPWQPADLPALQSIASRSFVYSRFAVDPFFTDGQVADFHAEWIKNLCRGLAGQVLVAGDPGDPVGFVSCSLSGDVGRIPLIAVDARRRGSGMGGRLVTAAQQWFRAAGARTAWVKTQTHNFPALRLYQRHGFCPARTELVFSISLQQRLSDQEVL